MEKKFENITNIQLHVSDHSSKEDKKILQFYWEMENEVLKNTPSLVRKKFNITQAELNRLNATYASLSLYLLCENCISYEKQLASSHSAYKHVIINHRSKYTYPFKCNHCELEIKKTETQEAEEKRNTLIENLNSAIDNKNWKNLSNFERGVLSKCLEMSFKKLGNHYCETFGKDIFHKLIRALYSIEKQHFITLKKESNRNYIKSYLINNKLKQYKEEIVLFEKIPESTVEFDTETNELKFKLTINENQQHPDQPMHAGKVTFKERIVIEPGVEYIFGQWKRANDSLYLTMIPIDQLEKTPIQKRISDQPISLQKGIQDFLRNLGKKLHSILAIAT